MKLLLTIEDYKARNPVYPMKVPTYLEIAEGMSFEQYYQAAVFCAQRQIDTFLQNYFSNREWTLEGLDYKLVERIKDIIFEEVTYLEQNQMFFVKSNDIQYSTAGQQTFTFSTNIDDPEHPLIPKNVIQMIRNTGLMNYAVSTVRNAKIASQAENQFADGFFVPKVRWSDKADNVLALEGSNVTLNAAITELYNSSVFRNNVDFLYNTKISKNFVEKDASTLVLKSKFLESDQFFPNKTDNAFAQIKDLKDIYQDITIKTDSNTSNIIDLQSLVVELDNDKISKPQFNSALAGKADANLSNVNLGKSSSPRYLTADTNGALQLVVSSGDLKISSWEPDKLYFEGEAVYIPYPNDKSKVSIFIASSQVDNLNKNPFTEREYWFIYELSFSITGAATEEWVTTNFLNLKGSNVMLSNLDLGGNAIVNCSNMLDKSDISDSTIASDTLWSSSKTSETINRTIKKIRIIKYEEGDVLPFATESKWLAIASRLGLVEGRDWQRYSEEGILFGFGSNGAVVGNGMIQQNNLPTNKIGDFALRWNVCPTWYEPSGGFSGSNGGSKDNDTFAGKGAKEFYKVISLYLNRGKQVQFTPKYKQVFAVEILKTVYETIEIGE